VNQSRVIEWRSLLSVIRRPLHCEHSHTHTLIANVLRLFAVPPAEPGIYNEQNEPIDLRAGPYEESGQLILTCVVVGGKDLASSGWIEYDFDDNCMRACVRSGPLVGQKGTLSENVVITMSIDGLRSLLSKGENPRTPFSLFPRVL
jgi:hypothetical protein